MFHFKHSKKGFTLIEMLVVIAIIAVLVAVIIPTVTSSTSRAKAATDAANLRSVLGQTNSIIADGNKIDAVTAANLQVVDSKSYPGAKCYVVYADPSFIDVYYVKDSAYYGLDYFASIAEDGTADSTISTAKPSAPAGSGLTYEWFEAGKGAVTE